MLKAVHEFDARDLRIWGVNLTDPVFLADYNTERTFWEAGGRKKGGMDVSILYQLARKHSTTPVADVAENSDVPDEEETIKRGPGRPRKEPALA